MIKLPIAILVAAVTLLGGFYGGYKIGQEHTTTALASNNTATGGGRNFTGVGACPSPGASPSASGQAAARGATGTVTNLSTTGFTVHNARCNTDEKVTFDGSLIVHKTANGTTADLQENQTVTIQGTRQSDGSIKANVVTIVPAGTGFGRGAGAAG
jgi:hypothetical protein